MGTKAVAPRRGKKPKAKLPSERFEAFCRQFIVHIHGPMRGKPFIPEPWQMERIIRPMYDTLEPSTGLRRYRTCYTEIARKNGKSFLAVAVALYGLFCDGEKGPQVISAAGTREQASLVFDTARQVIMAHPTLRHMCRVYKKAIETADGGIYKCVSADAFSAHGLSVSTLIFDEIWVQKTPDLYEALVTSQGARKQPVNFLITTSGSDRSTICYELHSHAVKVRDGLVEDRTFLPVLFGAPENADWKDPATWRIANPNLGVSVQEKFLRDMCHEAMENPAREIAFRQFFLSQWTSTESRWFSQSKIEECFVDDDQWPDFSGSDAWASMDISSTTDLTAVAWCHYRDGIYWLDSHAWAPAGALKTRERANRTRYQPWSPKHITITEGDVVDQRAIKSFIDDLSRRVTVLEVATDRWNAVALSNALSSEGYKMVAFSQGYSTMSPAVKDFETLVMSGKVRIRRNPLFLWSFSNVMVVMDCNGNQRPDKAKSGDKIDVVIAGIMCIARCHLENSSGASVYASRDIDIL
jgi:phage terminase large subunit-like protein